MSNFKPLEVVGRGSETQLQVAENSNYLIEWLKNYCTYHVSGDAITVIIVCETKTIN